MPSTFAYVRTSLTGRSPEHQIDDIKAAGFRVEPHRIIIENISGSTFMRQRQEFSLLLRKLQAGDNLIVTRLDCLGRDAIDVSATMQALAGIGVHIYCLALGNADLASSAGKAIMNVINTVAQFERDLLVERTQAGLARVKSEGKVLGRPQKLSLSQKADVQKDLSAGMGISAIARKFETSRQTIKRVRDNT